MKKIFYFSAFTLILFSSCKEKEKETVKESQEASQEVEANKVTTEIPFKVLYSNFENIQKLPDTKSDTVYITNYWATWCGPCIQEIPDFIALREEYKDKPVKFNFINVDKVELIHSDVKNFAQKNKIDKVYHMDIQELSKFKSLDPELTQGIPVTIVQKGNDKEGLIGSRDKASMKELIEQYLVK